MRQSSSTTSAVCDARRADGERDARAAPVELLRIDHPEETLRVRPHLLDVVETAQVPLASFPDDLPRHALLAIVLGRHGSDHLFRERAAVLLPLLLHVRSEEHTSELQSRPHLVCRLLLEKKNKTLTTLQTPFRS